MYNKIHMKKSIFIILAAVVLMGHAAKAQQDAQYSQYIFNGIYINPAYAGYKEVLNLHTFYRNQWTGIEGSPKTLSLAVDAIANDGNVGLALQVVNDKLGAQTNTSTYASYAYRLRMNADGSSRLAFGLSGGITQLGLDASKLHPNDPEYSIGNGNNNVILPDARVGIYFSNNQFFAGLSADNLISSRYSDSKFKDIPKPSIHSYLTAGMLIPLSTGIQLKPSFLFKEDFNGPTSLDLNAFMLFGEKLWIGGSYRTGVKLWDKKNLQKDLSRLNSVVGSIEVFPTSSLRIGYAYDFSVGPLQSYSGGTHEISIAFMFRRGEMRMTTPRVF